MAKPMRATELEQVFLRRSGGAFELRLVLESPSGSRDRVSLSAPGTDEDAALRYLRAYLRQRGLRLSRRARVRRQQGDELVDAPELLERLRG